MATYVKTSTSGQNWLTTAAWNPAGYPGTNGAADEAQWTSATTIATNTTSAVVTVGKFTITNPTGTQSTSGANVMTLDPSSFAGIGVELTSAGTTAFTLGSPTALGSSQEWKIASGRTLTVSGAISGNAKNLTLSDAGTKTFSFTNTGWTNSTVTVAGGIVNANTNTTALGAASNAIVVNSGANLATTVALAQTSITLNGAGISGGTNYGALYTTNALANTQTVTVGTTNTVISVNATSFLPVIAVSAGVTSLTLNTVGTQDVTFPTLSSYPVSSGVRLKSLTTAGLAGTGTYSFGTASGASDTGSAGGGLGHSSNVVIVEETGAISYAAAVAFDTLTASRSYMFLTNTATPATPRADLTANSIIDYTGAVTLTAASAGQAVWFAGGNLSGNLRGMHKFSGTLSGNADLWVGAKGGGTNKGAVGFGPSFSASGWTGTMYPDSVNYYGTPAANLTFPLALQDNGGVGVLNAVVDSAANHSSYTATGATTTVNNVGATPTPTTGNLTLGGGSWTSAPGTWKIDAGTTTLNFSFTGTSGTLTKTGVATLALGGANSAVTAVAWSVGNLTLNSAGAAGTSGTASFTATSTGTLDATTSATLLQGGANALNANFTWGGSADLTFGAGTLSWSAARTITFVSGKSGTLKFLGNASTNVATSTLAFGGAVTGSQSRFWLVGTSAATAATGSVTTGYFRISNATGLGVVGTIATWTVSSGGSIELINSITVPSTKYFNGVGQGPSTDGALRSVSGVNKWQGQISISTATGARIQVDAGTFTLDPNGSTSYTSIDAPAGTNTTPITFTALSGATLNQDRILAAGFSTVTIANGSGTVVLSKANLHSGAMTCSAGTTKLTNAAAVGAGAGNSVTVTAGATMESAVKAIFPATLTLGSSSTPTIFKVSA